MVEYINKLKHYIFTNENNRIIFNNALGAILVKGGALIVSLLTLPAYLKYFENETVLGLWFTILSVLSWILTFDLGIGNGLRNHLVPILVKNDQVEIKKYISSAYIIIGSIVLIVSSLSFLLFRFINWNLVFNIPSHVVPKETLNIAISFVFIGIMFQFLFRLITSILFAMQKSALNNFLGLLSSILILVYVSLVSFQDLSTSLITLAIYYVFAVNIPLLLATLQVFSKKLKGCRPEFRFFEMSYAKNVVKLGGIFFWVQIMYMVIITTNEFLITWLVDPAMVVNYLIYNKLFTLIGTVFVLALTPIWSAVTKALAEENFLWIKKLYRNLKILAIIAGLCQFGIIPFLQLGINIWLGDNAIQVNYFYAAVFALFGSILIWSGVISSIANGFGQLKTQSIFFTIGAVVKIPMAWFLVEKLDSWIGVIIANIIAMGLYCIVQPIWLKNYMYRKEMGDE